MGKSIYHIYLDLLQKSIPKDYFFVTSLPFSHNHKIGISESKRPIFFIECEPSGFAMDIKLEFITVLFNKECQLLQNGEEGERVISNIYTIVELNSDSSDFQQYFIEVIALVLQTYPKDITFPDLKNEIKKITELFSRFNKPPQKQIQGLWAELLIIEQAKDPDYLIQSWHSMPNDKFDFNDGLDKIEVKSTSQSRRIHDFSLNQLSPNKNSNLLIASVIVVSTGIGENIFDLVNSICERIKDPKLQFRLKEIIGQTIGQDFEKISSLYFDYQQAIDTLSFYDSRDIPTILSSNIPNEIENVRFACDLSNLKSISEKSLDISQSLLFKSI